VSVTWYLADWVVCVYEQKEEWEAVSTTTGLQHHISTADLSPCINSFRTVFAAKCRERFFTTHKHGTTSSAPHTRAYSMYSQATLLDARTKDFRFFKTLMEDEESFTGSKINEADSTTNIDIDNSSTGECACKVSKFNDEAMAHAADQLRESMKQEMQMVHSSHSAHIGQHRLHRIVDSMFVGKQDYDGVLGKREAGGELVVTPDLQQTFFREKMNKYAELELRQYMKLSTSCRPHKVLADWPLPYWEKFSIQFPITAHLARKFLAVHAAPPRSEKIMQVCRRVYGARRQKHCEEVEVGSSGLLDCIVFLAAVSSR
jgi:hypothetical protein